MKKKCIIGMVAATLLINCSVSAVSGINYEVKVDQESQLVSAKVSIEGDTGGTLATGLVKNGDGNIIYMAQGFTNNDGKFNFAYINNDENGNYTITVSAPRKQLSETKTFSVLTDAMKNTINNTTKDVNGIKSIIENYGAYMNLDMTEFDNLSNKEDVYSFMAGDSSVDLADIASIVDGFYGAVIVKTLAEGGDSTDYLSFLENDTYSILNKDSIPTGQTINLFDELSPDVKNGVLEKVISKNYTSAAELSDTLTFYVLEQSMERALQWTEINPVMSKYKDAGLINVDFTTYNRLRNKQNVDMAMMGKTFSDYNSIKTAFDTAAATELAKENTVTPSSGGGGGGGRITSVIVPAPVENIGQSATSNIFTDMEEYMWANEAVSYLSGKGIIFGMGDGRFAPENSLTREEVSTIIARTQKLDTEGKKSEFIDVATEKWSYPYVSAVYEAGLMVGVSGDMFGATSEITRNEFAVIMKRLIDLYDAELVVNSSANDYDDEEKIPEWAKESVKYMKGTGLMLGNTGNVFDGDEIVSRAYACDILYNVLIALNYDSEV